MEKFSPSTDPNKDHLPIYNIKAVSGMVDLLPVTLRAWERRYGLPNPHRGEQGYRLYSEYDLRLLRWLKRQNDAGMSIGQAVKFLQELREDGKDPAEIERQETLAEETVTTTISLETLAEQFYNNLVLFRDEPAADILRRAFSMYSVDQVLNQVIEPAMVQIGEAWHRGEITIAVEHFATQFCIQHLMSMLAASASPTREGTIFAACAPGEFHQIGLLTLAVMLRWRGWDVKYFGQDLSLDRLLDTLHILKPHVILFTATKAENATQLERLSEIMENYSFKQPEIILGGLAYQDEKIRKKAPGLVVIDTPTKTIEIIEKKIYSNIARAK